MKTDNVNFDLALIQKPMDEGLTADNIMQLLSRLHNTEIRPIEIEANEHECSAMGFIRQDAYEQLDYDSQIRLEGFIARILDNMDEETEDGIYQHEQFHISLRYD